MTSLVLGIVLLAVLYLIFTSRKTPPRGGRPQSAVHAGKAFGKVAGSNVNLNNVRPVMDDYNDYILSTGLEKGVIDSHKQFVDDVHHTTTGASATSVLSGDIYDVPFVGLRRPNTRDVYVDPDARQVTSAETWQYPSDTRYDKCGLF
jgi:hypothetical protein